MSLYFSHPKQEKQPANVESPDIHAIQVKNLETFVKTDFENLGEDGEISFEIDLIKHRDLARNFLPHSALEILKLRKRSCIVRYVDVFVDRMKATGGEKGVELRQWADR
ncbi:uncharacterized protein Bfra_000237 [Botrytis fragariae]|uniref:Uncharacterized protein n=1 Tax=Botrytis fragariae TaxID=1964551 RepID=A0A8H6EN71_9HELO|nr:uncharacterized protein Bfra_000237 [Botrytis fragariae]KAF5878070.1 hypothetical protein Bfra_000237 [Botrytis fragariae]